VFSNTLQFIKALQEEKDYLKIGAVGYAAASICLSSVIADIDFRYCSGGSTAIRLASTDWIQSVVICHPARLKLPDVKAIKVCLKCLETRLR
jgi:carboxymethylenebutenolidase